MFARLSHLAVARRWWVIGTWTLLAAVLVAVAPSLDSVTNSDEASFLPGSYESAQAAALADEMFPADSGASAMLVFQRADGSVLTGADEAAVAAAAAEISSAGIDRVRSVQTGPTQVSPDRRLQLARVTFDGTSSDEGVLGAVEDVRAEVSGGVEGTGLTVGVTGDAAIKVDDRDAHTTAEKTVGIATVTLILLLLLIVFRSPVAALLPLITVGLVFLTARAVIAIVATALSFDVSLDLPPLLTVVLFGIGTDYILFTLFRYRERLRAGGDDDAVVHAASRVGEVITFAAAVVMVAFSALALSELGSLQTMAPGLVIAVALMWLAGLTLVPAVLSLLGPKVFWPSRAWQRPARASHYRRLGQLIARRPGRLALASGGALLAFSAGGLFYTADYDGLNQLPADTESRIAFEDVRAAFPAGAIAPVNVYVTGDEPLDRDRLEQLAAEQRRPDGVASVRAPVHTEDGRTARIDVILDMNPYSAGAMDAVESDIRAAAHATGVGDRVLVGGQTSALVDIRDATNRDMAVVFPIAGLVIALLLAFLLRSLVAPLYLLAAVVLGFTATLGVTVAGFQGLLGEAGLKSSLPVILYLFVVAVGTDYSILMTARLREEALDGHDVRTAGARGVEHAGPAVGAAGLILAGTFTSLLLTGIASLMQIGFAVSVGILIAALVMASVLVPSMTILLGRRAWWPGHRDSTGPVIAPTLQEGQADRDVTPVS